MTRTLPKKLVFLVVFGVAALALGLATLFTNFTEQHISFSSTVPLPVGSPEFATAVEGIVQSSRHPVAGEIEVFDDGSRFFADLIAEIGRAQHSVTITNYIFRAGEMTDSTFKALTHAALRGVQVRLLLDAQGGANAPDELVRAIERAGGRTDEFRPRSLRYLTRMHRRNHSRSIVVDGEIGYTGGLAFDDGWLGDGVGKEQWRDVMFKYRGPLARATQNNFNALWRQTNGEILSGPGFYPTSGTDSAGTATAAARADSLARLQSPPRMTEGAGGAPAVLANPPSAAAPSAAPRAAAGATASASWFVALFHNPQPDLSADLQDLVWLSIHGAQRELHIATPYMTPDEEVRDAIMAAARRGVRVELVMPGPYTDAKLIQAATRAYYDDLLASGVRIFEYEVGRFHQKTMTADGHWSIIGSANLDNRSATLNVENVFAVEGEELARTLDADLEVAKGRAKEITQANWHPSPLARLYFNAARLFAKQY